MGLNILTEIVFICSTNLVTLSSPSIKNLSYLGETNFTFEGALRKFVGSNYKLSKMIWLDFNFLGLDRFHSFGQQNEIITIGGTARDEAGLLFMDIGMGLDLRFCIQKLSHSDAGRAKFVYNRIECLISGEINIWKAKTADRWIIK